MAETRHKQIAQAAAKILLDTKSVLFNAAHPFTLTSGKASPVYVDCRRLISFVREREILMDFGAEILKDKVKEKIDGVAGGETAGIAYAAFMAERLSTPMLYVRKKPKGFGRMAQIEGVLPEAGRPHIILVEDMQTDGGSKKVFVDALREAGAEVRHAFVIFHYGIFAASETNMKNLGLTLHALTTWWDVLEVAREHKYFDEKTLNAVQDFLKDPHQWSVRHLQGMI